MSIYSKLEKVIPLNHGESEFGRHLGSGEFTVVYKIDYPFVPHNIRDKFEEPVLVITADRGKMEILESLIDSNFYEPDFEEIKEEAMKEWLYEYDFSSLEEAEEYGEIFDWSTYASQFDIYPLLNNIYDELEFDCFFMERATEVSYSQFLFSRVSSFFIDHVFRGNVDGNPTFFIDSLNNFKFNKELVLEMKESLFDEYFEFIQLFKVIKRDIIKACKTEVLSNSYLSLDLHSKQFIELDKKVYLSDAFVY